jgi:NAD(P)-dependent dehydrogenase (short-subunit alcohol dehydrogenase family)
LNWAGEKWLSIAKEASPLKRIGKIDIKLWRAFRSELTNFGAGKPSDIANLIVFLSNPEKGGWIVGKNIGSDGGLVINN